MKPRDKWYFYLSCGVKIASLESINYWDERGTPLNDLELDSTGEPVEHEIDGNRYFKSEKYGLIEW